jgi:hypothetical protein
MRDKTELRDAERKRHDIEVNCINKELKISYNALKCERNNAENKRHETEMARIKALPVEPEIDIQRWELGVARDSLYYVHKDNGVWCKYSDVVARVAMLCLDRPRLEKGKVFWGRGQAKVFVLTGEIKVEPCWHMCGNSLYAPDHKYNNPEVAAQIIDTPVYTDSNGDRYIWDGGDERVPIPDEVFVNRHGSVRTCMGDGSVFTTYNNGHRMILIKLTEVG